MKVLLLVQKEQRAILDRLYEGVAGASECDLHWLTSDDQRDLRGYFRRHVKVGNYDRIVMLLRFKKIMRQAAFLYELPNLVLLEHDAYQNYIACKYTGQFSKLYHRLPGVRVISSGYQVSQRLREEGIDAVFVPKGYDQALLHDDHRVRDIELGFVGSLGSVAYSGRRELLEALGKVEALMVTKTNSGDEYRQMLCRIRFFASADVGMGEYMIKNFEAMACGCVLLAYDQGEAENQALGFVDMHNIVLYRDIEQLREKLAQLRQVPELAEAIAARGQALVQQRYSFQAVGESIVEALREPLPARSPLGWAQRLRLTLGF